MYAVATVYMVVCLSVTLLLFSESLVLNLRLFVVHAVSWYQAIHYPKGISFFRNL